MNVFRILSAALVGTTAMTLTSYAVSTKKNKQFREPELLAMMLKRIAPTIKEESALRGGWLMHYGVGVLFSIIYDHLWSTEKVKPTITNGAVLGVLNGAIGAAVWKGTFKLHPNPPKNDRPNFYTHLIVAHAIFGATVELGYRLANQIQKNLPEAHTPPEETNAHILTPI
jgi:hypothetical protein